MPNTMIGSIDIQPSTARPGETIRVEVRAPEDKPIEGSGTHVSINGVPGAVQHLQFPTEGKRRLHIRAVGAAGSEREVQTLNITGTPVTFKSPNGTPDIAMIGVTQQGSQPYVAVLTVGSFIDARAITPLQPSASVAPGLIDYVIGKDIVSQATQSSALETLMSQHAIGATKIQQRVTLDRPAIIDTNSSLSGRVAGVEARTGQKTTRNKLRSRTSSKSPRMQATIYDLGATDLSQWADALQTATQRTFEWDFGDGTKKTTNTPTVTHDFFPSIDHASGIGAFNVSCRVVQDNITVTRTLTMQSAYQLCKRTGTIVPHTTGELFAHKRYTMITGSFIVHNVEDEPLVLDRVSTTPTTQDPDAVAMPNSFVQLQSPVTIAPHSTSAISVNIPFVTNRPKNGQLPYDCHGFTVIYAGNAGDYQARCSYTFDIPVSEWDAKPSFPEVEVPELVEKVWPWELVEDLWSSVINPGEETTNPGDAVINAGDIMLDKVSGTVAVSLGGIAPSVSVTKAQNALQKVFSGVYAPVQQLAMETGTMAQPMSFSTRRSPMGGTTRTMNTRIATKLFDKSQIGPAAERVSAELIEKFGGIGTSFQTMEGEIGGPPAAGPVAEGQICQPDNITEDELSQAEDDQLVCQLTDETMDVLMPARWMNARKGDSILSPGGDGIIGGLMLRVNPPQWYSHSGIMTRNYDEITHSTGSQKRLMDNKVGVLDDGTDGFDPHALKYMWPGAITQSVQASIEGENFPDPEHAKTYSISAFGKHTVGVTHNDQMVMIPPLVVKPDPLQETPAVRSKLHGMATDARSDGGRPGVTSKYHYSFFGYTDPTPGLGAPEGPAAGWAAGTRPSVCSSFIWMKAEGRNLHLETDQGLVTPTDLEQSDVNAGAAVRPTTPDGLYTYSAQERLEAGEWLFDEIYNMAYDQAGWFGEIITDAADDIANQFLNVFENGDADGKDNDNWRQTEDADAVSPDNMLWWDSPAQGGIYGFAEPAIYREPRIESYTVSRWKKVVTRGNIHGTVFANGSPIGGAMVQVYESKNDFSAGNGIYELEDVPLGTYMLTASKVIDGTLHSVQQTINLNAEDMTFDVHLLPPDERNRLAQVFIDFRGVDYETFDDNEIHDPGPEYFELELSPSKLTNSASRTYKWGGELRMEYTITVKLLVGNQIDVVVNGVMYEGTDEETDDLDGQGSTGFQVGIGETKGATLVIMNTQEDDDDEGKLSISVKNVRNDN